MLVLLIFLLTFSEGVLSGRKPPKHKEPNCPQNEHYVRKDTTCPKTCGNRLLPGETEVDCDPFTGCVCDSGYLRLYDNGTGPCVPKNKCAPIPKKCGKNEMPTSCQTVCPPQDCESMYLVCDCEPGDCIPGCDCIDDYLRNEDGDCVPIDDCFLPGGYENDNCMQSWYTIFSSSSSAESNGSASSSSSYSDATSSSHSSSSSSSTSSSSSSTSIYTSSGCGTKCKDLNAVYKTCPNPCPLTCAQPKPRPCPKICLEKGCECKPGFILTKIGGICIPPGDCPEPLCPKHEHYVMNDPNVIMTCGNRLIPGDSAEACTSFTGCLCDSGYVRKYDNGTGPCIPKKECPPIPKECGINEEPSSCRIVCPPQTCESVYSLYDCLPADCEPGCNCKDGFLRNSKGVCIPSETCPGPQCPNHERYVIDDVSCIKTCGNKDLPWVIMGACIPYTGCICEAGYYRKYDNETGPCIKETECPKPVCGENEVASDCKIVCPPQSCESIYTTYLCANGPCTPGCNCKDGFLRNSLDVCIPSDQCFSENNPCDDPNASPQECASTCQPTCEDPDISDRVCTLSCRLGGCVCNPGYILDKAGGTCIRKEDCPKNQNCSDPNASPQSCPSYCQPTCNQPDTTDILCVDACLPSGCVCNPGYILDMDDGICIKIEDCPVNQQCTDPNASPSTEECTSPCQPTCDQPDTSDIICILSCQIGACVCNPGYILDKAGGTCIKKEDCPPTQQCSDPNASPEDCPSYCQPTCDQPDTSGLDCVDACLPSGCVCNLGYVLDIAGGTCIKVEDCPDAQQCSDPNASPMPCPSYCQPTCGQPDTTDILCVDACLPSGCVCNPGYILEEDGGKCIKVEDCPDNQHCSDPNASPQHCPSYCQPTCNQPDIRGILCIAACLPSGCVCNPGFILDTWGGTCIRREECPVNQQCSDPNASPAVGECTSPCQPTCEDPDTSDIICIMSCQIGACLCNPGYILDKEGGTCIKIEDCPGNEKCKDPNASPEICPSACQPTCEQPDTRDIICAKACLPGGCVCDEGYILDKEEGTCIEPEKCPGGSPKCPGNKTYVDCFVDCQNRYCPIDDDSTGIVMCNRGYACSPGCACMDGYLMSSDTERQCILSSECPPVDCTKPNEVWDPSPSNCNQERCEDMDSDCDDSSTGPPRCVCKNGYYRNSNDICVPASECDNQGCDGDRNATSVTCPNPHPPTCSEPTPNIGLSAIQLKYKCMSIGCECKSGFVLSERGGKCIDPIDCPDNQSCNGDNNATIKECPNACPATCANPDTRNRPCPAICLGLGCQCKPGFILSKGGGECIDPDDCPGGEPACGANKTYVYCYAGCPDSYCPTDDSRDIIACDPPYPCPSGCDCEPGYLMLSYENPQCVLSSDCPPVTCTRPNEVWDPSPCNCNLETCDDIDRECDDTSTGPPKCVCKSGYYRNDSDICVLASECDNQGCDGDRNATSVICPNPNPPTCAKPGPNYGSDVTDFEIDSEFTCTRMSIGCECKPGFILSERGGQCIDPSDCPDNQSCNGDFNATIKQCPNPCPATCADPDTRNRPCPDICLGIGCDCKNGFILSEDDGECISPMDCPGGIPDCGQNKTYVDCFVGCPPSYCPTSDSRAIISCAVAYPCPSGCACNLGYLMLSYEDSRCVLSSECPPVTCTRPNEVWNPAPSNCYLESCDDIGKECDDTFTGPPKCVCKRGYFRNESDICVLASECDRGCNGDPNAKYSICPSHCPPTCEDSGKGKVCIASCARPGCVCKHGYIFSKKFGKCVKPEQCPPIECNGDPNAVHSDCPSSCPRTCNSDDDIVCIDACAPPGCVCKPGYVISDETGQCIKEEECPPKGCKGDPNAVHSDCPSYCPRTCNSDDDLDCIDACAPPGCVCKPGYVISDETGKCIKEEECPPNECNGDPNAVQSDCPSYCPRTCDSDDDQVCILACAPPGCVCKPGYVISDETGKCIKEEECPPKECNGDPNAMHSDCPSYCPITCDDSDDDIACIDACAPPGCVCKKGYIISHETGKCVKPEECPPKGCKGDPNAVYSKCPSYCQLTCDQPDLSGTSCVAACAPPGCVCKPGYLKTKKGKCVKPDGCPGGIPNCGANKTYVPCKVGCPTNYCPTSDSRAIVACSQPYPCSGGCACNSGYLFQDDIDENCIKSSDCPPVKCTRPNEVWDPSPSNCYLERCEDMNTKCDNNYSSPPRCVCKPGYYRNNKDICIPASKCPKGCKGDPNAVHSDCPSYCPRTCNSDDDLACIDACAPPGCVCKPGYVISDETGTCIKEEECPPKECNGDPNAVHSDCPSYCPRTCNSDDDQVCILACAPPGCVCKPGYVISDETGKCIKEEECPPKECNGDPNAMHSDCPSYCPITCDDSDDDLACIDACAPPGCVCKPGYIISHETGKCVKPEECPPKGCKGDPNAVYSKCPSYCPLTCDQPDLSGMACIDACAPPGCVCKPGYLKTKKGKCVKPDGCPGGTPNCGANKTYVPCKVGCPTNYCPTSDSRAIVACSQPYPCSGGCACNSGYLFQDDIDEKCIKSSDCPPVNCTRPNEVWDPSPSNCHVEKCEDMMSTECNNNYPSPPRCVCKPGYYRNNKDICIPASKCPKPPLKCGLNEKAVKCRTICPPQNCEISYTDYDCRKFQNICEPGCDCISNYLRNGSGICILNDDCPYPSFPICGPNEIARDCRRICPPQTCESRFRMYKCLSNITCEPGCDCIPYYLRNSDGECIRADKCDAAPLTKCPISKKCIRTCTSPNPPNCPYTPAKSNIDGCECMKGYILSERGGTCIKIEDCPIEKGCNGDLHARTKQCPLPCPSTCDSPNATPCKKMCEPIGCECEPGYIFCTKSRKCVLPDNCPGGNPCGVNEEFRQCKDSCPEDYCPVDDSREIAGCDPWPVCLSGCACKLNHRRLSQENDTCVVASDCPPVDCTRQNEVWDGCPSDCFSGYCEDKEYQDTVCNTLLLNCQPKCICKRDYFRNGSDICVPESECPSTCSVSDECLRTCDSPSPPNCPYEPSDTNIDGCNCMEGYILSQIGGECIRIEECPSDGSCNGDPNASPKRCPTPCPSTCKSPEAISCKKRCDPIGCECKTGFILSKKSGQCIKPNKCPGGNPCGPNADFVSCKNGCPTDYCPVDDSRAIPICEPIPEQYCLSGCKCKLNHKWYSRENKTCIVSSDCPPVDCTRQNEIWDGCPSDCFSGYCEDKEYQDTVCNTLVLNCQPKCICKRDYFRNGSDICVPESECPSTCSVSDECLRTCDSPNPPNCPYEPSDTNIDGCNCMKGYILSKIGGECIRIEECPSNGSCNGDPNARPKLCPIPCPSTCKSPEAISCKKRCDPIGCECKPGYILSKSGQCIKPDKCPGGNPCGPNANFVPCKNGCPTDYCPVDDRRAVPICEPIPKQYCLSGCKCKLNHKWVSRENKTCIVSSDCPPVNCTRPKEMWNKCPSACLAERCEDVDNQPRTCQTLVLNCQPKCVCEKNFFRNKTDICVPSCDC